MRSRIVGALVAVGLLRARAACAEDPCAADVKQLCGEVKAGRGAVQDCLKRNEAKLSPACVAKRAAADAKFRGYVQEFATACGRDAARLCSGVKPGGGRVAACLLRQQDDLSGSCHPAIDRVQAAVQTMTTLRTECRADVERLCAGVPNEAGPLVECVQANQDGLSEACRSIDPAAAMESAQIVDAINASASAEGLKELAQVLQGIDSIAFSRSQILLQLDSYQGLGGTANADRLLFNPQLVFGDRRQFSLQLKAPVLAIFPYAADRPAQTGLGAVTTAFGWAFLTTGPVHQYLSLGLQWISPVDPPVGDGWAVTPSYAISVAVAPWLSLTQQLAWSRSFASSGYPELNLLLVEPLVVVNLPGRTFVALDTKLGWHFESSSFLPLIKGVAGISVNRQRSLTISAWYQHALSNDAATGLFKYGVGLGLAYFFDW